MPVVKRSVAAAVSAVVAVAAVWTSGSAANAIDRPFPQPPAWVADQTLYECNLRQFSPAGNVAGLRKQLPRLKALGVGTVWVMPVNPIGRDHRNGSLGSPYAPRDYLAFNPEFGTIADFKAAVADAHALGLHVIVDWVAVHTAPDHVWVAQHPDWYKHDAAGQLVHPEPTWTDVVALDYGRPALRRAMIDAMLFWVREADVDGFRCDTAEYVPLDFWCDARDALRAVKPVFLLAEGSKPELMAYAFDAAYGWDFQTNLQQIAKGTKTAADLANYFAADATLVPPGRFRLNFTTNHDKNAWEGTTAEQLGGGVEPDAVLSFVVPGMPLIFNGQEAGAEHRLAFFEHDPIVWRDGDPAAQLYRALAKLKADHPALAAGAGGAPLKLLPTGGNPAVLAVSRQAAGDRVVGLFNLSDRPARVPVPEGTAGLTEPLGDHAPATAEVDLPPYGYRLWATDRRR